jgi:predicted DNA-binding antitoxin AbrB/MazE fold protein
MNKPVDAVYENGVLRPLEPLELEEHQHVKVLITQYDRAIARTQLDSAYLSAVRHEVAGFDLIPTLEEVHNITAKDPTSWSEFIIAERQERF